MTKRGKIDLKEAGLELTVILGRYFLKSEHLHYGYWPEGLEVSAANLPRAQEEYCNLLVSNIPDGTKTILDVGCGTGAMAEKLLGLGFEVDCVSPGTFLTDRARKRLGGRSRIYQCRYEDLRTDRRYDLVLFAESFQYVEPVKALDNTQRLLANGGHVVISDVFIPEAPGRSPFRGGRRLAEFYETIARYPFEPVKDLDITNETAPNVELAEEANREVLYPLWRLLQRTLSGRWPRLTRLLRWRYRKKIEKMNGRFFSGDINAESFKIFRSYRLMVYRLTSLSGAARLY